MRIRNSILIMAALSAACAAHPEGCELPADTPFARSSTQEGEYRPLYRAGYEAAGNGCLTTYCLFGLDHYDPVKIARSRGWTDGQTAGYLVWADELEKAIVARDRKRLVDLLDPLAKDTAAVVEKLLADDDGRTP
jgi:hypothetical protein